MNAVRLSRGDRKRSHQLDEVAGLRALGNGQCDARIKGKQTATMSHSQSQQIRISDLPRTMDARIVYRAGIGDRGIVRPENM